MPSIDYGRNRAVMGKIMPAGSMTSLGIWLVWSVWAGHSGASMPLVATLGREMGLAYGITDVLLVIAPLQALPAGLVWAWRRAVSLVLLAAFITIRVVIPRLM